jgi:uncharacterized SAM-binding protein YcdF (DUF218 family)
MLILGGGRGDRELNAFALYRHFEQLGRLKEKQERPPLDVWVSSGGDEAPLRASALTFGIPATALHFDYGAVDTVTNFTSLIDTFSKRHYTHVVVVTDDVHMVRARTVARIIFQTNGIKVSTHSLRTSGEAEPLWKVVRDYLRCVVWYYVGYAGSTLSGRYHDS